MAYKHIIYGGWKPEKPLVTPEYQAQLDDLAESVLRPISEEQLTLEWDIQEAVIDGRMTVEEGAQCLDDYISSFGV